MNFSHKTKKIIFLAMLLIFIAYTTVVAISEPANPAGEVSEQVEQGKLLFQQHNCISCHQIYGLGGYMGPDLTNIYSTKSQQSIEFFLRNGSQRMPNFFLNEQEINAMIKYLEFIDKSGIYPVKEYELTWYGTVNYNAKLK